MKREVSPELYNYNKYPGPSFARVGDKVVAEGIEFDLVDNYKDGFDQSVFGQRFSRIMLKFDYIVGDWGNEQLRLRGFYKDSKNVLPHAKISHLEDYLTEYCNFGCAYFVLENANPQDLPVEIEERPRRKRNNRSRNRKKNQDLSQHSHSDRAKNGKKKGDGRHFTLYQDKKSLATRKGSEQKREKKQRNRELNEAKRNFVIRQK